VESRKAWRNRDASAAQAVLGLLEALRHGLGADTVGLFDDDRSDDSEQRPVGLNFWDSFGERSCGPLDWEAWHRALRAGGRVDAACRCVGSHRLHGFMIHARWALLLVVPATLPAGSAVAIASSLHALAEKLPAAMTPDERRQAEFAQEFDAPAAAGPTAGVPVWWIRKRPS
jgi:hypothetical protein